MDGPIAGWRLAAGSRAELLDPFPPRYAEVVADHVTHGRRGVAPPLPEALSARVGGRADDGVGVEALVVEIGASTARWDGSRYHLTWSLAPGRAAKESNDVIASRGWQPLEEPIAIELEPADWP
ncbi:MAG: hypothetical protein ACEQR8_02130 [Cypionkella sp.]